MRDVRRIGLVGIIGVFSVIVAMGCGKKGTLEDCSSDDECESGCCEYEDSTCSSVDYGTWVSDGLDVCIGQHQTSVCCSYEEQSTYYDNLGNSHQSAWDARCDCLYKSCSEVTGDSDCSGGSCTSTSVRNVNNTSSCS
jgi:hypothetical protein